MQQEAENPYTQMHHYTAYVKTCIEVCENFPPREFEYSYEEFQEFMRSHHVLENLNVRMLGSMRPNHFDALVLCKVTLQKSLNKKLDILCEEDCVDLHQAISFLKEVRQYAHANYLRLPGLAFKHQNRNQFFEKEATKLVERMNIENEKKN